MEDVIPYLEQIARPGCRVIFLVHYSVEGFDWFQSKSMPSVIKEQTPVTKITLFLAWNSCEREVTVALDI